MRVLITGGCGFIGVNLVRYLIGKKNYEIVVLDNFSVGKREYLEEAVKGLAGGEGVKVIEGDIRDKVLCEKVLNGVDAIVHLAAQAGVIPSIEDPFLDNDVNVIGTLNLLYAAVKNNVQRFIFSSSNAPLGQQSPPVNEARIPRPLSPYGASKLACEGYCSAFHGSYGLKTIIFRFSNAYGPYSLHKSSVIARFIKDGILKGELTIYGDGTQTRDFVHVNDICKGIYSVLDIHTLSESHYKQIWGTCFHLGTGEETAILDLARLMQKLFDNEARISFAPERKGEIRRNYSDISRAREMLGFEPDVDLETGLEETILYFVEKVGSKK
jgi:UDP-glucose 4-epimerase